MILLYRLNKDIIEPCVYTKNTPFSDDIIWIDFLNPTRDEELDIEKQLNISLPTHEDMVEIEESSRFYMEDNAQFLTAPILSSLPNDRREIAPITFVLVGKRLITIRYSEPKAFSLYINHVSHTGSGLLTGQSTGIDILLGLMEAVTDKLADLLELVSGKVNKSSESIFSDNNPKKRPMTNAGFRSILNEIGNQGTVLSQARESIAGINRLLVYVEAFGKITTQDSKDLKQLKTNIRSILRDTQSLEHYADFLSNKMSFLLDTVVGLISTEQNAIIKIFSVAAVVFMPPTLIASIYGMNFHFMPELDEKWGYPIILVIMIISAILPLYFFKKKGWL